MRIAVSQGVEFAFITEYKVMDIDMTDFTNVCAVVVKVADIEAVWNELERIGFNGHGSYFATRKLIKELKKINPDVIHLHNVHGYYLNLKLLFNYLKNEFNGKIVWTLHDCWAFTGHCSYFTIAKCNKWKKCCNKCPQLSCYPKQIFDTTKREFKLKKELSVQFTVSVY